MATISAPDALRSRATLTSAQLPALGRWCATICAATGPTSSSESLAREEL
eukprot:CAMPEP_0115156718 /NCGR_PEP_ID=MMETSP0227-20121206/68615_1 /TAXON_ID=89957 /ORGANISM="Polarella glacialis, Strain CCMP 1383" /LENGTH=49 /DNA_ID= /DNA_START= /DNA_END= /DNA_ORIENTATION=